MRILVIFAHPVETSFHAALHRTIVDALTRAGHEVDDCDLYAEGFDPVLGRDERLAYHDTTINQRRVAPYVARLMAAQAIVFDYPVWSYGMPAILKGFLDRLIIPGIAFTIRDGTLSRTLTHIRKLAVVTSYGQSRWMAWFNGDTPRKTATRYLRAVFTPGRPVTYLAHYDMNRSTPETRAAFLKRVERAMARF